MKSEGQFSLAPEAEVDMLAIWAYIARDSAAAADRLWQRLTRVFQMLARQPLIGESAEELASRLRSFPVGSYVVYYVPLDDGARIVRVIHASRDIPRLF